MLVASDPLAPKKGGKKGMKAALLAARQDPDADLPNRIVDLVSLEQQIRRFLADIGGRDTMVLPPCDKETRKRVHELADAFNLKSQSKGKGKARYTTLTKTTRSGVGVNEKKVKRIMRQVAGDWNGPEWGGRRGGVSLAKHQEGEEIGKVGIHSVGSCLIRLTRHSFSRLHQRLASRMLGTSCSHPWAGRKAKALVCLAE